MKIRYLILMNLEESLPHLAQTLGGAGVSLIKPQIVHCHFGALVIWGSFGSERFVVISQVDPVAIADFFEI